VDTKNNRNKTNNDKSNNDEISRRGFLELGSAAVTGVAGVFATRGIASAQELVPVVKTGKSTYITVPGPTDKQLDAANPDMSVPRLTADGIRELHLGAQQHRPSCDLTLHRLASIQMRSSTGRTLCSNPAETSGL
jgi:hypothetical protein